MTNFVWFCRQADEQFLTNVDGTLYNATSSVPYTDAHTTTTTTTTTNYYYIYYYTQYYYTDAQLDAGVLNTTSLGGCFRQGPGLVGISGQGKLTFGARNMLVNDVYVFRVIVAKGERSDVAETRLHIVPGNSPAVNIG